MRRNALIVLALVTAWAGTPLAEIPQPSQAFLDAHLPPVRAVGDSLGSQLFTSDGAFRTVRRLLEMRRHALADLARTTPLTELKGIATRDQYEETMVSVLHRVVTQGVAADTTRPPEEQVLQFVAAMGLAPDLGESPVAFMVLEMAELTVSGADSVAASSSLGDHAISRIALKIIEAATRRYEERNSDFQSEAASQKFRESSVVLRLRCPADHGSYTINSMKNKISEVGGISTVYFLQCKVCASPLSVEFPQGLASRLNRMAARQKFKVPPAPVRSYALDP